MRWAACTTNPLVTFIEYIYMITLARQDHLFVNINNGNGTAYRDTMRPFHATFMSFVRKNEAPSVAMKFSNLCRGLLYSDCK